jgi:hypothetical protein
METQKRFPDIAKTRREKGRMTASRSRKHVLNISNRIRRNATRRLAIWRFLAAAPFVTAAATASAAGTPAGTVIDNVARVDYEISGTPGTVSSNVSSVTVQERIDVVVTLQSPQVPVAANETDRGRRRFRSRALGDADLF